MKRLACWGAGLSLFALGINCNDPLLAAWRDWMAPLILALGVAGVWLLCRQERRPVLLMILWAAVAVSTIVADGIFQTRKATVLAATEAEAEELGRHFIVGYEEVGAIEDLVRRGLIGGIYVTRRNLDGRTVEDLRQEIAWLQDLRRQAGHPPLLVSADQEGGAVAHLSPWLPRHMNLSPESAEWLGTRHGSELAALGVTVNLAPVLDLKTGGGGHLLDFRSLIGQRAVSGDPAIVAEAALAYTEALGRQGVRPTLKHFPGLGRVGEDTHFLPARLDLPVHELEAADWLPFRQVLAADPGAILMVGHVTLAAIDPDRPASISRRVVDGLLRQGWGFDGPVMTDDLTMLPIYQRGLCRSVVEALNAGVDLLLIAYDGRQYYKAMACVMEARRRGALDPAMLGRGAARHRALAGHIIKIWPDRAARLLTGQEADTCGSSWSSRWTRTG